MNNKTVEKIRDRLVKRGWIIFKAKKAFADLSKDHEADKLLNDLTHNSHAFLLGCLMDRRIKAERAWLIPYLLRERIKNFSIETLGNLSLKKITYYMSKPPLLHRDTEEMSNILYLAIQKIISEYKGNAANIWKGNLSSSEVVYRILQFRGAGPKIACMAVNILATSFKIKFSDYSSIDISADVHVKRVFGRLGLCNEEASVAEIIYKARSLYPKFPGIMDPTCWSIGHDWCKASDPICDKCFMKDLCPSAKIFKNE